MTDIKRHSLTDPQQLHTDVDPMIATNSTNPPTTTTEQRRKRQNAVNYARASVGLEGFKPSEATEQQAAQFIAGEIGLAKFSKPAR